MFTFISRLSGACWIEFGGFNMTTFRVHGSWFCIVFSYYYPTSPHCWVCLVSPRRLGHIEPHSNVPPRPKRAPSQAPGTSQPNPSQAHPTTQRNQIPPSVVPWCPPPPPFYGHAQAPHVPPGRPPKLGSRQQAYNFRAYKNATWGDAKIGILGSPEILYAQPAFLELYAGGLVAFFAFCGGIVHKTRVGIFVPGI